MHRHARQIRLAEVGASGQARIEAACAEVGLDGLVGEIAVRYLVGAGVRELRVGSERLAALARSVDPAARPEVGAQSVCAAPADGYDLRDPIARELAQGARGALRLLKAALGGDG